jgi:hypothetical protein
MPPPPSAGKAAVEGTIRSVLGTAMAMLSPVQSAAVSKRDWQYLFQDVYALTHARPASFSEPLHAALSAELLRLLATFVKVRCVCVRERVCV